MRVVALLVIALAACGGAQRPAVGPWSTDWREARSPHFVVTSDVGERALRERVRWLEHSWWSLAAVYGDLFPGRPPPSVQLAVIHHDDCEEPFGEDGRVGGMVIHTGLTSVAITCGHAGSFEQHALIHELVHLFNMHYLGQTPRWLNEGLAEYFATIRFSRGKVEVGRPRDRRGYLGWLPQLAQLTGSWEGVFESNVHKYYAAAWVLVHLLFDDEALRPRFFAYLTAIARGDEPEPAWQAAFAGADVAEAYEDYRRRHKFTIRGAAIAPPPEVAVEVAAIDLDRLLDVHLAPRAPAVVNPTLPVWAPSAPRMARMIDALERRFPSWRRGAFWRASLALRSEDPSVFGIADPVAAVRAFAPEPRALAQLVAAGAATDDEVRALVRTASTPHELLIIAEHFRAKAQPATGIGFARRALRAAPMCAPCEHVLAAMLAQQGKHADAVAHQERAIALCPEGDIPDEYRRALSDYRRRAATPAAP